MDMSTDFSHGAPPPSILLLVYINTYTISTATTTTNSKLIPTPLFFSLYVLDSLFTLSPGLAGFFFLFTIRMEDREGKESRGVKGGRYYLFFYSFFWTDGRGLGVGLGCVYSGVVVVVARD